MLRTNRAHAPTWSLVGAAASWGIATVISKRAVEEIEPLALLPLELAVSVAALAAVTAVSRQPVRSSTELRRLGVLGLLNPGLSYALGLAGLALIPASMSVLLWATEPLLILLFAWLLLRQRVTSRVLAWSLVALVGVLLVVFVPGAGVGPAGVAFTVAGVAACAIYTVLSSCLLVEASSLSVVFVQQAAALLFSLVLLAGALGVGEIGSLAAVSATGWASAAVAGVLYYAVAFWFYLTGLRRVAPAVAGVFLNLIPIFGLAASRLFLGEQLTARQWVGAAVIVTAVVTITRPQAHAEDRQSVTTALPRSETSGCSPPSSRSATSSRRSLGRVERGGRPRNGGSPRR